MWAWLVCEIILIILSVCLCTVCNCTVMESCVHVRKMQICQSKALLNPKNWSCNECGTTDGVWACLTCSTFSCGRTSEGHALQHFKLTKHSLAIEVNQKFVHCYSCNDWVINDNCNNDIKLIQSMLDQVAKQQYQESYTRSGLVIRPAMSFMRMESRVEQTQSRSADKIYTANVHWKRLIISKMFTSWRKYIQQTKKGEQHSSSLSSVNTTSKRRNVITPGVTGLRNLGNTCYMNATLQALGHLHLLRETFRHMADNAESSLFNRQTTIECFQRISTKQTPSTVATPPTVATPDPHTIATPTTVATPPRFRRRQLLVNRVNSDTPAKGLCEEVHGLMRIMWSGKWAVVTPHTVLTSIWHHLPSFRGYCQQDAHEFLCELLMRLQTELTQYPSEFTITITNPTRDVVILRDLITCLFEGTLANKISYNDCDHTVIRNEQFWDLSLQFPDRYHSTRDASQLPCHLLEMMNLFTEEELITDQIFCCDICHLQKQSLKKQLIIQTPPEILRLHLKRFRYFGRNWQKITTRATFPMELDINPYFLTHNNQDSDVSLYNHDDLVYDLSCIIVHHGSGFACGHYTSYCWNNEAGSWVHCNDARLSRCSDNDVLCSQAYVLFYSRRTGRSPVLNRSNRLLTINNNKRINTISTEQDHVTKKMKT